MKYLKHLAIVIFLMLIGLKTGFGQDNKSTARPSVESKKFDLLLSKMIKEEIPLISVEELNAEKENYFILDAREINEYKVSHIESAKYIGYDKVDFKVVEGLPKDTPIVIYCSIGVRSEHIGIQLSDLGFTNVKNLYGSIFEWANQGYNLVDNAGYPTKKVHAYNWMWGKWMVNDAFEKVY